MSGVASQGLEQIQRNNKERSNTNRFYENSFINKTYNNVRSFGKDLSNMQQYQEAKNVYGDGQENKSMNGLAHQ